MIDRMRRVGAAAIVGVIGFMAMPPGFAQGDAGFLRGAGVTDVVVSYSVDSYSRFWVGGDRVEDPGVGRIERQSLNLYVAQGLRDDLDLFAAASYVESASDGVAGFPDEQSLQDLVLGGRWRFYDVEIGGGTLSLLAAPSIKIPMTHYEADNVTAIGDGQIDYRARVIVQQYFDCGAFVALETGFDLRTEATPNEVPVNFSLGATLFDQTTVTLFYNIVRAQDGIDIGEGPFPDVEEESDVWGVSAYFRGSDRWGVTIGVKDTIDGRNTGDVRGGWAGLVFRR